MGSFTFDNFDIWNNSRIIMGFLDLFNTKMKKIIVARQGYKELTDITYPLMEAYAQKIGADFSVSSTNELSEFLALFDQVCYLSPHILVSPESPDIFDGISENTIGFFNEAAFNAKATSEKFYNLEVLVFSRIDEDAFKGVKFELLGDEQYLGSSLEKIGAKIHELDYKFNRIPAVDLKTGESRFKSWFVNYTGIEDLNVIKNDAEFIKKIPIGYTFKRKIWIKAGGGMGDEVQLEPTLRFMCEKIYPDEDIRVSCHWPELFSHLPLKAFKYGDNPWKGEDGAPWIVESMPDPKHFQWLVVSAMLCHTIDFSSMAVLRRTLPNVDKEIKVSFLHSALKEVHQMCDRATFEGHVLIHSGRHWLSKTFPVEYWQAIIDGIEAEGLIPILIGKNSETQGVQDVHTNTGINLIDKLSLQQLIALISAVPILLTNDSAPLHIAGAFDNQIVLIPSCKHPDHLLPFRQGRQEHKTTVLYKRLTLEDIPSAPTEMYTKLGDIVTRPWEEYLPDVADVVKAVLWPD